MLRSAIVTTSSKVRKPAYIHTYALHSWICEYMQTYTECPASMYMHTYRHTSIHIYIHSYMHEYIHTYIHTYTHTYIYTYIHTYIHTSMHIGHCAHGYGTAFSYCDTQMILLPYLTVQKFVVLRPYSWRGVTIPASSLVEDLTSVLLQLLNEPVRAYVWLCHHWAAVSCTAHTTGVTFCVVHDRGREYLWRLQKCAEKCPQHNQRRPAVMPHSVNHRGHNKDMKSCVLMFVVAQCPPRTTPARLYSGNRFLSLWCLLKLRTPYCSCTRCHANGDTTETSI